MFPLSLLVEVTAHTLTVKHLSFIFSELLRWSKESDAAGKEPDRCSEKQVEANSESWQPSPGEETSVHTHAHTSAVMSILHSISLQDYTKLTSSLNNSITVPWCWLQIRLYIYSRHTLCFAEAVLICRSLPSAVEQLGAIYSKYYHCHVQPDSSANFTSNLTP